VVPTQLREVEVAFSRPIFLTWFVLGYEDCPRVTSICTQNHVMIEKSNDACGSTEHGIDTRLVFHLLLYFLKGLLDLVVAYSEVLI
jgi:hypothetical protein